MKFLIMEKDGGYRTGYLLTWVGALDGSGMQAIMAVGRMVEQVPISHLQLPEEAFEIYEKPGLDAKKLAQSTYDAQQQFKVYMDSAQQQIEAFDLAREQIDTIEKELKELKEAAQPLIDNIRVVEPEGGAE